MLDALAIDPQPSARNIAALPAEEVKEECASRAQLYRLLGGVFAEEPSAAFLAALRAPESMQTLHEAGLEFNADFTQPGSVALAEILSREYTAMFVASGGFPPVESVRLTGRYYQQPNFEVKQAYRQAGFEVRANRFRVFEDQLGVELMFVAELLDRSVAALERGDMDAYRKLDRDIKRFWALHLGRWVRGYARLVRRATEHSFYREMAKLLALFAEDEIARMRLRVEDIDQAREVVPKSEVQVLFNPDEPVCNACGEIEKELGGDAREGWQPLKRA